MIPNLSRGADFAGLIHYLVDHRDHELLGLAHVSSIEHAAAEMSAVASLSERVRTKLLHLSLSASPDDGVLTPDQWLLAVHRHELEFGLAGHQRVIVRHRDKDHDHVHSFWCTVSVETGQTPPKRWFLEKGCGDPAIGPRALTGEEVDRTPPHRRKRKSYDSRMLPRAQHVCRELERELKLRELRTPAQAANDRAAGAARPVSVGQVRRAERTGSVPLVERAADIRAALDTTDWSSRQRALGALGLAFKPVSRVAIGQQKIRGVVIFDLSDPANSVKASQFDLADRRYGWRQLESRNAPGALGLEEYWAAQDDAPPELSAPGPNVSSASLKAEYDRLRAAHVAAEFEKKRKRHALREKLAAAIAKLRGALMRRRRGEAKKLARGERRAFYSRFDAEVRAPAIAAERQRFEDELASLSRSRWPDWSEFVAVRKKSASASTSQKPLSRRVNVTAVMRSRPPDDLFATPHPALRQEATKQPTLEVKWSDIDDIDPATLAALAAQRGRTR
ncbi:relaxase/mobilization nuclease domain-containing protein [Sphingomonas sp. ID0503]|uniref:relaxase/mobilization nuclease domain-containing protein n=1 Tax=Sphingomonas sp. ID0503 TaxID=3399691 RepID=UPI003AFADE80